MRGCGGLGAALVGSIRPIAPPLAVEAGPRDSPPCPLTMIRSLWRPQKGDNFARKSCNVSPLTCSKLQIACCVQGGVTESVGATLRFQGAREGRITDRTDRAGAPPTSC